MRKLIVEKVEWVFDHEIRQAPHIAWISVRQLIFGKGMHWNEPDCPKHIITGLIDHLKIKRASNNARRRHRLLCKWEIPDLPEDLFSMVKNVVKAKIVNPILKGENYNGINPLWARGYIDGSTVPPTFDETKARDLAGWFFYLNDPTTFDGQKRHLESFEGKNRNITCQFKYNSQYFETQLRTQYAAISSRLELLDFCSDDKFSSHKLIEPKVSEEEITWKEIEDATDNGDDD